MTVFLSILNKMNFHLVQNRKENCHHDHIPFNVKGNGNIVFSVNAYNLTKIQQHKRHVQTSRWDPSELDAVKISVEMC